MVEMFLGRFIKRTVSLVVLGLFLYPSVNSAGDYKSYQRKSSSVKSFSIAFIDNQYIFKFYNDSTAETKQFITDDYKISQDTVYFGNQVFFSAEALSYNEFVYAYQLFSDIKISSLKDNFEIIFYSDKKLGSDSRRKHRGNLVTLSENIAVDSGRFFRGFAFSVAGNISVAGEVNKNIISLLGNINLSGTAVARGDIATLNSLINIDKESTIYGEIYSGLKQKATRLRRYSLKGKNISLSFNFRYNRVDGANPNLSLKFKKPDFSLPSLEINIGYAFEAEQERYRIKSEFPLIRDDKLLIGASRYRLLISDDDWLLSDHENIVYTLFATEDYKDYIEAEGTKIYFNSKLSRSLKGTIMYESFEETYLPAQPHLWSMFGGNKLFRANKYFSLSDGLSNAAISVSIEYDQKADYERGRNSFWHLSLKLEKSSPDFNSDYSYNRFLARLSRDQKISQRLKVHIYSAFGSGDGLMPVYKQFYLGGLGTLRGYDHKELAGSKFWMTNIEFIKQITETGISLSAYYGFGQIAGDSSKLGEQEIKQSFGLGFNMTESFRFYLAKRLDGSEDKKIKFYLRFSSKF